MLETNQQSSHVVNRLLFFIHIFLASRMKHLHCQRVINLHCLPPQASCHRATRYDLSWVEPSCVGSLKQTSSQRATKKKTHITPLTHMEKTCKIVVSYVLMLFYCIELFEFAWQTTSLTNEITWWFLICHVPKCPSSMQQTNLLQVGKKMRHT